MAKLTVKMARFVEEYLVDFNATQAAIRAGYSKKTAHVIGIENLGKPIIKNAIDKKMKELSEKTGFNRAVAESMFVDAFDIAKEERIPSAMVAATTGLCKMYGLNEADKEGIKAKSLDIKFSVAEPKAKINITSGT